jgi:hypothetical protein
MLRLVHVVGGEENRLAERLQLLDHVPGAAPGGRIEPGRGLVEKQELGIADQGNGHVEPPSPAARQGRDAGIAAVVKTHELEGLVHRPRRAVEAREEHQRLGDREQGVELTLLEDEPNPLAPCAGGPFGVCAEDRDLPAAPLAVALQDLDRRGLAGAVRTQEAENLARMNLEVEAAQDLDGAIALAQPLHRDCRHASNWRDR